MCANPSNATAQAETSIVFLAVSRAPPAYVRVTCASQDRPSLASPQTPEARRDSVALCSAGAWGASSMYAPRRSLGPSSHWRGRIAITPLSNPSWPCCPRHISRLDHQDKSWRLRLALARMATNATLRKRLLWSPGKASLMPSGQQSNSPSSVSPLPSCRGHTRRRQMSCQQLWSPSLRAAYPRSVHRLSPTETATTAFAICAHIRALSRAAGQRPEALMSSVVALSASAGPTVRHRLRQTACSNP